MALDTDWSTAYWDIAERGYRLADMPSSNAVWGSVLKDNGFKRYGVSNTCPDCYTAEDFCRDNGRGIFVLGFGQHVATVIDGAIFDSWDSSKEIPQYYWRR